MSEPTSSRTAGPDLADFGLEADEFRRDLLAGLRARPRSVPPKYLYDRAGSLIFDRICEVPEYYPTRTEALIMRSCAAEIAARIGPRAVVVEPGAGNGDKGAALLELLEEPVAFLPVEISKEHLVEAADRLHRAFPAVEVLPVCADFFGEYRLPETSSACARVAVYFPGSTIGNMPRGDRHALLTSFAEHCRAGEAGSQRDGGLLIGFDLVKDEASLVAAYDDAAGVTAEFGLNLLARANRELSADFDLAGFRHEAVWDEAESRVELRLVSRAAQTVSVGDESFSFAEGDVIVTEHSHKFTPEGFAREASAAGLEAVQVWTDDRGWFAVGWFEPAG